MLSSLMVIITEYKPRKQVWLMRLSGKNPNIHLYMSVHVYVCVCVRVCAYIVKRCKHVQFLGDV